MTTSLSKFWEDNGGHELENQQLPVKVFPGRDWDEGERQGDWKVPPKQASNKKSWTTYTDKEWREIEEEFNVELKDVQKKKKPLRPPFRYDCDPYWQDEKKGGGRKQWLLLRDHFVGRLDELMKWNEHRQDILLLLRLTAFGIDVMECQDDISVIVNDNRDHRPLGEEEAKSISSVWVRRFAVKDPEQESKVKQSQAVNMYKGIVCATGAGTRDPFLTRAKFQINEDKKGQLHCLIPHINIEVDEFNPDAKQQHSLASFLFDDGDEKKIKQILEEKKKWHGKASQKKAADTCIRCMEGSGAFHECLLYWCKNFLILREDVEKYAKFINEMIDAAYPMAKTRAPRNKEFFFWLHGGLKGSEKYTEKVKKYSMSPFGREFGEEMYAKGYFMDPLMYRMQKKSEAETSRRKQLETYFVNHDAWLRLLSVMYQRLIAETDMWEAAVRQAPANSAVRFTGEHDKLEINGREVKMAAGEEEDAAEAAAVAAAAAPQEEDDEEEEKKNQDFPTGDFEVFASADGQSIVDVKIQAHENTSNKVYFDPETFAPSVEIPSWAWQAVFLMAITGARGIEVVKFSDFGLLTRNKVVKENLQTVRAISLERYIVQRRIAKRRAMYEDQENRVPTEFADETVGKPLALLDIKAYDVVRIWRHMRANIELHLLYRKAYSPDTPVSTTNRPPTDTISWTNATIPERKELTKLIKKGVPMAAEGKAEAKEAEEDDDEEEDEAVAEYEGEDDEEEEAKEDATIESKNDKYKNFNAMWSRVPEEDKKTKLVTQALTNPDIMKLLRGAGLVNAYNTLIKIYNDNVPAKKALPQNSLHMLRTIYANSVYDLYAKNVNIGKSLFLSMVLAHEPGNSSSQLFYQKVHVYTNYRQTDLLPFSVMRLLFEIQQSKRDLEKEVRRHLKRLRAATVERDKHYEGILFFEDNYKHYKVELSKQSFWRGPGGKRFTQRFAKKYVEAASAAFARAEQEPTKNPVQLFREEVYKARPKKKQKLADDDADPDVV